MKYFFQFCLVLLLGFSFSCNEKLNNGDNKKQPPAFETVSLEEIPVYNFDQLEPLLSLKNDTTYIVNFWATWCKPCVEELPYFEELNKYAFGKKMKVILVSLDFKKQLETKLVPFMNEHKIQSEVVVLSDPDSNRWINKVDENWSGSIPVTLIYDNKNKLFLEMTFANFEDIRNVVDKFDNEI